MSHPWEGRWLPVKGSKKQGGQGASFLADPLDGQGDRVFIKTLLRPRDPRARKRFAREVAAYETLSHLGLPALIHHNRDQWQDRGVELFLVLEAIDGPTLGDAVKAKCFEATDLLSFGIQLCEILATCHAEGVVHRDLKPANVMLRGGDPQRPVVVDFGLSFNSADVRGDPTRLGEEVGNRFLRLPEHAKGGRDPASDLTQAAGLILFATTGIEPRMLQDAEGRMPHQRDAVADKLRAQIPKSQLLRLQVLLDRAFDTRLLARYQAASELAADLKAVLGVRDADDLATRTELVDRLRAVAAEPQVVANAANRRRIAEVRDHIIGVVRQVARSNGAGTILSGARTVDGRPRSGRARIAIAVGGSDGEGAWMDYRFDLVGDREVVVYGDDEPVWRGEDLADPELAEAVESLSIRRFLASRGV